MPSQIQLLNKLKVMSRLFCPGSNNPFKMDKVYLVGMFFNSEKYGIDILSEKYGLSLK